MGAVRIEIFRRGTRFDQFPGSMKTMPLQVETETSTITATTPGSRIAVDTQASYHDLTASIVVDEDCLVAIGADPTAAVAPALSALLKANVAREFPVRPGDLFSFKDVA